MKKNIISAMAIIMLSMGTIVVPSARAQIFLDDESMTVRSSSNSAQLPIVPELDVTTDQYAPLGGEMLLLGSLGGAYLFVKRNSRGKAKH